MTSRTHVLPQTPAIHRRTFAKLGALGLRRICPAGIARLDGAAAIPAGVMRDKAVVFLFLQGGPSHIEFFDPKMSAPAEYRSKTGEAKTKHAGITFGGTFPKLAAMSDKLTIVRSYGTQNTLHTYLSITGGGNPLQAAAGAICARLGGTVNPASGMPRHVVILPEAVMPGLKLDVSFETDRIPTLTTPGSTRRGV